MLDAPKKDDSIKLELSDGTIVLMDYTGDSMSDGPVTVQGVTHAAEKTFGVIKSFAKDLKKQLHAAKPDKATVEFSIELEKNGGDLFSKICNVSGKGGFKVTLEWEFNKNNSDSA